VIDKGHDQTNVHHINRQFRRLYYA